MSDYDDGQGRSWTVMTPAIEYAKCGGTGGEDVELEHEDACQVVTCRDCGVTGCALCERCACEGL